MTIAVDLLTVHGAGIYSGTAPVHWQLWLCLHDNSIRVEICRVFTRSALESSTKNSAGCFLTTRNFLKKDPAKYMTSLFYPG